MPIVIEKTAAKALRKMPTRQRNRMRRALHEISLGNVDGKDIKRLQGREGFRLRQGRYRAIYQLNQHDETLTVVVMNVGPRGGIYR